MNPATTARAGGAVRPRGAHLPSAGIRIAGGEAPLLLWSLLPLAWSAPVEPPSIRVADVAIVPGCPSNPDGTLSTCQWRRITWAHHLYASGLVDRFIVSGNAAYNPFVEADALAAGLVALGVPADRVHREPEALHTDENVAYSLRLAETLGVDTVAVASDSWQAPGGCAMARGWSDLACVPLPVDVPWSRARLSLGVPEVRTEPVTPWIDLRERERRIAEVRGTRPRPHSAWVYLGQTVRGTLGEVPPPEPPPAYSLAP